MVPIFYHDGDNALMTDFEHLLKSYDVGDELDAIASADPPAYLRRCFAEGISTPELSFARVQQLAVCAMVLDAILHDRDYAVLEPELIADWRVHYVGSLGSLQPSAVAALHRALDALHDKEADAVPELEELVRRLEPA